MDTIYFSNGIERLPEYELENRYRDFLNDYYKPFRTENTFYSPSLVLERTDPIAFRCGFSDWLDAGDWYEADDEDEESDAGEDAGNLASEQLLLSELDS